MSVYIPAKHAVSGLAVEAEASGVPYELVLPKLIKQLTSAALTALYRRTGGEVDGDQEERLRALIENWWYGVEADEQLRARPGNTP